jgi:hypothetical protein
MVGIRSFEIILSEDNQVPESSYTVKLYFSELEDKKPGERVFDIKIQNQIVTNDLDIAREAGKTDKELIRTYYGVRAGKSIKVELLPETGNTLICGIELVQENLSMK